LLHELADQRCSNFGTCSEAAITAGSGRSDVNFRILGQFKLGQSLLQLGKCEEAIAVRDRIVRLMSVPIVQSSLLLAYKVDKLLLGRNSSVWKAEAAAYAAAMLPRIAACNPSAAEIISDNMKIDSPSPMSAGYTVVKEAFESSYLCLGITCEDIGGLVRSGPGTEYYESAEPCKSSELEYISEQQEDQEQGDDEDEKVVSVPVAAWSAGSLLILICGIGIGRAWQHTSSYGGFLCNVVGKGESVCGLVTAQTIGQV
jgi:hypothetical protein